MNKPLSLLRTLGLALAAAPAWADRDDDDGRERTVNERRPLKANAHVDISNVAGMIEIQACDKNELHLTGYLAEQVEKHDPVPAARQCPRQAAVEARVHEQPVQ